jgi:hypothetical protein
VSAERTVLTYKSFMGGGLARGPWAAGWVALGLSFARQAGAADPPGFARPVEEHRLANGLRVVLAPDDTL